MVFDPDKFEAVHFSQNRHFPNPKIVLPPVSSSISIEEPRVIQPV